MTTGTSHTSSSHRRPPAAAILIVPLLAAIVITLFAWPSARLEPRDLPIGVAGSAQAVQPLARGLAATEGAFDVHRYADEATAREAIRDREVYGAFVATPAGPKVLTASAASPMVAQLMTHAAPEGAPVEDVVPSGPRGSAVASAVLPLVLAGLFTGALCAFMGGGAMRRAGMLAGGALLAGLAGALVVDSWLDIVGGDWLANASALGLTVLAVAATVAGAHAVRGPRGIVLALLTMVLVGNPFSGAGSAPELLPEPVGGLARLLPPGAGANLLRSTGFFDGAGGAFHVAVLAAWTLGGLALMFAAAASVRRPQTSGAPVPA